MMIISSRFTWGSWISVYGLHSAPAQQSVNILYRSVVTIQPRQFASMLLPPFAAIDITTCLMGYYQRRTILDGCGRSTALLAMRMWCILYYNFNILTLLCVIFVDYTAMVEIQRRGCLHLHVLICIVVQL